MDVRSTYEFVGDGGAVLTAVAHLVAELQNAADAIDYGTVAVTIHVTNPSDIVFPTHPVEPTGC